MNTQIILRSLVLTALPAFGTQAQRYQATAIKHGTFDCFQAPQPGSKEKETYCETSAVAYIDGWLYMASDKNMPTGTPVFRKPLKPSSSAPTGWELQAEIEYVQSSPLRDAKKYEDFALSPDGQWVFATTGFDRIDDNRFDMDDYNVLLAWQRGKEEQAQVVSPGERNGLLSSSNLRLHLQDALSAHYGGLEFPYFKIEGIAALPKNQLVFGIRERGKSYDEFQYAIDFVRVSYSVRNDSIVLGKDWKVIYSQPNSPKIDDVITPLGLSSIEYDPFNKRIYLLTSFELDKEGLGAYLWILSEQALKKRQKPELVYYKGKPLRFFHKAEDLTPLSKNVVFVLHDDDRILEFENDRRFPHQAAYNIVRFK